MAKGITQDQVNAAADALVAAGHNPTVEKIRLALGTGSPNTVTRMMGVWRGTLAQRLQDTIQLPEVPPEVGQAFAEVWRLALSHAEQLARAGLKEEQNALFAAQSDLTQERKVWEIALVESQTHAAEHAAQRAQADVQLGERQTLVEQLEAQQRDLLQQRDRLQSQLDQEQREHSEAIAQLTMQLESLHNAVRSAERSAAHQAGQVAALEAALRQWHGTSTSDSLSSER